MLAWVSAVHGIEARDAVDIATVTLDDVEADPTRCPSPEHAALMSIALTSEPGTGTRLFAHLPFAP